MEDVLQIILIILIVWLIGFILLEYKIINDKRIEVKKLFLDMDDLFVKRMSLLYKLLDIIKAYDKNQFDEFGSRLYDYINNYSEFDYNKKLNINREIESEIKKILLVSKVYPELKNVSKFVKLEKQLIRYGKVIKKLKYKYNNSLDSYNKRRKFIISKIISRVFNFYDFNYCEKDK